MTIGKRLRDLRNERGLTLRELGTLTKLSYSGLAEIERGERTCNASTLKALSEFFCVSVDYLLCQTDDRTPSNNILDNLQVEILNSTQDLTPEQKQDVLTYIDFLKAKGILKK